jgi:glycine/serine hydroxymethyltransferase
VQDPKTRKEWQEAVNAADFLLTLDSARQYGLVTGGPHIDAARCCDIVKRGAKLGVVPQKEAS